ncbi:MAG: hypothetical protein IJX74_03510 [Clostridia bacterium]|nr:hypothetical protein [Clostridia bacterium]
MKLNIKIISALLAFVTLLGTFSGLFTVSVFAAEETAADNAATTTEEEEVDYTKVIYATPEEKLASMKLMTTKAGYQLYADAVTGEVAIKNTTTDEILFTNPYDVATSKGSEDTKYEILSQIIVNYIDNGSKKTFTSYEMAALRDQIKVKNIKNGIRVEYTIGREEARRLVPRLIEKSDFETAIVAPMLEYYDNDPENFWYKKFMAYYTFQSLKDADTDKLRADMLRNFPITEKYDVYVFDPNASTVELEEREEQIKTACPNYSYEEMDAHHQKTEYQGEDENPPVFKMALEYTIGNDGAVSVRLPANGLRFNESMYQLENISILPYMGAGNNAYEGYTFYPDGSGALFTFDDLNTDTTTTISGKVYGVDYAYHKITGTYQENITYPVFGVVEDTEYYDITLYDELAGEERIVRIDGAIYNKIMDARAAEETVPTDYQIYESYIANAASITKVDKSRGYVGIIEEGDAMADIATYHAGAKSNYNTIQMYFNPRPKDSYNLADAISVGTNSEWTVVSSRKYVGNYKIRYLMLTDDQVAADKGLAAADYYKTTWLGMAFAYRDYLIEKGVLSKLSADATSGDIPMYVEAFGAMDAVEKIMSIPVEVTKPLTSFENVMTMYKELADKGVSDINFKLTGYANGGIYSTMPSKIDWEKVVEEDMDFQELLDYAAGLEDGNLGVFPDFEFSYIKENTLFDAVVLSKHAIKTIDDRYTTKRVYSATQQRYMGYGELAISPAYFNEFYESLVTDYTEFENIQGMSVGSLGNALNSDFDEDEPYNREDSKGFITKALEYLSSDKNGDMEIMVDGGNAYTWEYVDHILGVSLDSSRYIQASYSVPFIGVVLHGYMNFAGDPLNMEGDVDYAMLKAIENGASIYFTLSYDNTEILKEDMELSKYYSIRYDIWKDDVVEIYNELNAATKDVQDKLIIDHQYLSGVRIPDSDELYTDIVTEYNAVLDYQKNKAEYEAKKKTQEVADARELIANVEDVAKDFIQTCLNYYSGQLGSAYNYANSYDSALSAYVEANCAYTQLKAVYEAADEDGKAALKSRYEAAEKLNGTTYTKLKNAVKTISNYIYTLEAAHENLTKLYADAQAGKLVIDATGDCPESILLEIEEQITNIEHYMTLEIGINLNVSVEALAVDTFIQTHLSLVLNKQHGAYVEDYAESILRMMEEGTFGLNSDELDLLRYLEANKKLTDKQLISKYKIDKDGKNLYGIVLYIRELIGNVKGQTDEPKYSFDPALSDEAAEGEMSEVDEEVLAYYMHALYSKVSGLYDSVLLPTLNFVPTRVVDGELVSNSANIGVVTNAAKAAIKAKFADLTKGKSSYNHNDPATKSKLEAGIAEAVSIIEKDNTVKYATPETLEDDVRAYAISCFYQEVIDQNYKATGKASLPLVTKDYDVKDSISLLYKNRIEPAISEKGVTNVYHYVFSLMENDEDIVSTLDNMAAVLEPAYGDARENLENYLLSLISKGLNGKQKETSLKFHFSLEDGANVPTDDEEKQIKTAIKEAAVAITDSATQLDALIAAIVAELDDYDYRDDKFSLEDDVAAMVYYYYYTELINVAKNYPVASYYYDEMLGKVDCELDTLLAEHKVILDELISDDATATEKFDIILELFADEDYKVVELTKQFAEIITYYPTKNGNLADDTLSMYLYGTLNAYGLTGVKAVIPKVSEDTAEQRAAQIVIVGNVNSKVDALIKTASVSGNAAGCLPNYALSSMMTDKQLDAYVDEIIAALEANKVALPEDKEALAELKTAIKTYVTDMYYSKVLTKIGAARASSFSVADFYSDGLYAESMKLKSMLRYYATTFTPLTEYEIDNMIRKEGANEEEDEYSKYATDKGKLVAVTYGTQNEDGSYSAYKTFLLNYNSFSAKVKFGEVEYTITPYGFVTVMH